jgi:hypothetical protein
LKPRTFAPFRFHTSRFAAARFGNASGTWAYPTAAGWCQSTAETDVVLVNSINTNSRDTGNFPSSDEVKSTFSAGPKNFACFKVTP